MSKFLSHFIQNTSGPLQARQIFLTIMHRRGASHRTPKFKPEVKVVGNRPRQVASMSPRQEKVEVLPEPTKSVADKKLYKTIKLENGLTALLISDPSRPAEIESSDEESLSSEDTSDDSDSGRSEQSGGSDRVPFMRKRDFDEEKLAACALTVGVGSYSDPPDMQGLAHFVEHMVFMGSEKYPKENEFDSFIKKKGGSDNASTDCEVTTFYFEIPERHLAHAMDMFSQFFVSPLMLKEAMQREREAIESEFAMALPSDSNRKDQLLSSFFPEGHPARTFTWGNLKSLRDNINDDEKLHRAAHEFMRRHYSAHRMTVAVQARMDLATLEQYVINTFGRVRNNKLAADDFKPYAYRPDIVTDHFKGLYYVKPVGDTTEVHITWCMKSLMKEYETKPHQYISFLLGHEGKGSLLSYLKKKVWALGIYTGNSESGIDYTSMYSLFSTQIVLTQDGLQHVDEVIEATYSYINMLRRLGPSKHIFDEIKSVEDTNFRFEEEMQPSDYVETLSENMQFYPPQHYITGEKLYFKYDEKAIMEILEFMTPDMANVIIMTNRRDASIRYDQKEKWFGTDYQRREIPESWMKRWMSVEPYPDFKIPDKNIYITTNFDLIPPAQPYIDTARELGVDLKTSTAKDLYKKGVNAQHTTKQLKRGDLIATVNNFRIDQPNLLRKNRQMELWYKPDFKFRFPTALLYFYFITPLGFKSPREACLLDLWTDVLQQELKEDSYPAQMAELTQAIWVSDKGIMVKINGYNQNLHLLMELVSRRMVSSVEGLSGAMFGAVREVRARVYYNTVIKPHKLSKDLRMQLLLEPYISPRIKGTILPNITLDELKDFGRKLLKKLYVQVLVQGNLAWHEAIDIADNVYDTIMWEPLSPEEMPDVKVHQLPLGEKKLRVMSLNQHSANSMITNYYQAEAANVNDTATLEVIMMQMEEPVFDFLRTKEQLGYSVFSMMRYTFGVLGFSVSVNTQANKFSVWHVDGRVEAFLKQFVRSMRRLSEKELRAAKTALVHVKHTADIELKEEAERHWKEIVNQEYNFQRLFIEADAIEAVTMADVRKWVDNHFLSGNKSSFRKLSIQVMGHQLNDTELESQPTGLTNPHENYALVVFDANQLPDEPHENKEEFIKDIESFKNNLPFVPVRKVQLALC
ncbi:nardilysin [Manduca sexta]|uniref:nardilysin n=1 Tax=Manduca sexta TaxID=7130 RepID=UPI00188FA4A0|nr:nardilysin [Manduca sexta]